MRIQAGNRLVASYYNSQGIAPSEKKNKNDKDKDDKEQKLIISGISREYKLITDAIVSYVSEQKNIDKRDVNTLNITNATITRILNSMISNPEKFSQLNSIKSKVNSLKFITNEIDYNLARTYSDLVALEARQEKTLKPLVEAHPLWDCFFKNIRGVGPVMAAVCIAYLDPTKSNHCSGFIRYCGLDTVQDKDSNGNFVYVTNDGTNRQVIQSTQLEDETGIIYDEEVVNTKNKITDDYGNDCYLANDGTFVYVVPVTENGENVYEVIETGEKYVGDVTMSLHGRRKGDTEMFYYTDSDGNQKMKRGITYNPIVKSKMMGVLADSFVRCGDPVYNTIYRDYKNMLDNNPKHKGKSGAHKNMMAKRYAVKQFLKNLWCVWRAIEGLPVTAPYEVGKLELKPHLFNAYQWDMYEKYANQNDMSVDLAYDIATNSYKAYIDGVTESDIYANVQAEILKKKAEKSATA